MEDQRISFETAKIAKLKGFNEPTNDYFYNDGTLGNNPVKQLFEWRNDQLEFDYSRPTQTTLARWLREEKGVWVSIAYAPYGLISNIYFENKKYIFTSTANNFTYEDLFESDLKRALHHL